MPADLDALRMLAKTATPGPWRQDQSEPWAILRDNGTDEVDHVGSCCVYADARYLAAVSPDVVLALIDEVERLRAERDEQPDVAEAERILDADHAHHATHVPGCRGCLAIALIEERDALRAASNLRTAAARSAEHRRCKACDRKSAMRRYVDREEGVRYRHCRWCGHIDDVAALVEGEAQ